MFVSEQKQSVLNTYLSHVTNPAAFLFEVCFNEKLTSRLNSGTSNNGEAKCLLPQGYTLHVKTKVGKKSERLKPWAISTDGNTKYVRSHF